MTEGTWRGRVRVLKRDASALVLACRDRRTPWYAKLAAVVVAAYAFSPIDLIPDFIPVLGLLDDLVLVPLGILLVRRLVPEEAMADCRAQATVAFASGKPVFRSAAVVIAILWAASACLAWRVVAGLLS
jgi:uncharacterized membrane protein YkvA (DUF1232 family)